LNTFNFTVVDAAGQVESWVRHIRRWARPGSTNRGLFT
jgi:hypothetical protein